MKPRMKRLIAWLLVDNVGGTLIRRSVRNRSDEELVALYRRHDPAGEWIANRETLKLNGYPNVGKKALADLRDILIPDVVKRERIRDLETKIQEQSERLRKLKAMLAEIEKEQEENDQ